MRPAFYGLALLVFSILFLLPSCGSDDEAHPGSDVFTEQSACRTSLTGKPDTEANVDVYVDVVGLNTYVVTIEDAKDGKTIWKTIPDPLEAALLDAYGQARKAGKPVRIVYGPGLLASLKEGGGKVETQDTLEAKQTYYATLAVGCTEAKFGSFHAAEGDCIPEGAKECRVQLLDACDEAAPAFLDISFTSWEITEGEGDAATAKACYGVKAGGSYAIALPASKFCQCGVDNPTLRGLYDNARLLLDAALEIRGIDQPTAHAISSGMASSALSNIPTQ